MSTSWTKIAGFSVLTLFWSHAAIAGPITPKDWKPVGYKVPINTPLVPDPMSLPPGIRPAWKSQAIVSVIPSFGDTGTDVVIAGKRAFGAVTAVWFGDSKATFFTVRPDGAIYTRAPSGMGGSTVAVSVSEGSLTWTKSSAFAFPVAQMYVAGPLPYSPSDWDVRWFNGAGHGFSMAAPPILSAAAPPVLHVHTQFLDDSMANPPSYQAPFSVGNYAIFTAQLQACKLPTPSPYFTYTTDCTNWDGNSGHWEAVGDVVRGRVDSPGPDRTGDGDLALPTATLFDEQYLARTLRIEMHLEQHETHTSVAGSRMDSQDGRPFTLVISPAALLQVKLVPFTIVYQPPGNASTNSYQTTTSFNISYKLGTSKTQSNISRDQQSQSTRYSIEGAVSASQLMSLDPKKSGSDGSGSGGSGSGGSGSGGSAFGITGTYSLGESWDDTTVQGYGTSQGSTTTTTASLAFTTQHILPAMPDTIPGHGDTCASATDCSQLAHAPDALAIQPFWGDTFVFQVHPQFAAWVLPAGGARYVMMAAAPVWVVATVAELMACWQGVTKWPGTNACDLDYADSSGSAGAGDVVYQDPKNHVTLTPDEAGAFLRLDPFVRGQSAPVSGTRGIPFQSTDYGSKIGGPPRPLVLTLTSQVASATDATSSTTTTLSVTAARTTTEQFDLKETLFGVFNIGGGPKSSETVTNQNDLSTTYSQSTAVTTTQATQASVMFNDLDTTVPGASCGARCHLPLPQRPVVAIYLDKIFGGFMFRDPAAAVNLTAPGRSIYGARLLNVLASEAAVRQAFADVPPGSDEAEAVGVLVRTGLLAGVDSRHFAPEAGISRIDLAAAIDTAVSPPAMPEKEPAFADLPATTRVSRVASRVAAAKLVEPRTAKEFGPFDHVTRGALASTLAAAFHPATNPPERAGRAATLAAPIADEARLPQERAAAIRAAVASGWLKTRPDGTFAPDETVTRAEAARAIYAALSARVRAEAGQEAGR